MLAQQKCSRTTDFMNRLADDYARDWVNNVITAIRNVYKKVDIWPTGGAAPTYVDLRMGKKEPQNQRGRPVYTLWIGQENRPQLWLRENYRDGVLPCPLNQENAPLQKDIETWLKSHKNLIYKRGAALNGDALNPDNFLPKNIQTSIEEYTLPQTPATTLNLNELAEDSSNQAIEGQSKDYIINRISRNQEIIKKRKEKDKYTCQACGFQLVVDGVYIIDCHHINPLSNSGKTITSINDLVCLCPTCHRIAHTKEDPLSVGEIKEVLFNLPKEI